MSNPAVSILSEVVCELGEGPTYDPATDTLWWFDILGRKLLAKKLSGGETQLHELPLMASAMGLLEDGRHLLVTEKGLYLRDQASGALQLHTPIEAENPQTRSNDSRVHPSGAFWIGTMGKKAEPGAGAIYWFYKGEVRRLYPGITIPNSICFSPDGAIAHYADTARNILWHVDCNPENGLPVGEPKVFLDQSGLEGGLDGSVIDADGVLWNARWGSAKVDAYAPDGSRIRSIPMPARQCSCPAFVGAAADRIAVTSAWEHMDEEARRADPHAGKTFLIDLPVRGRHEPYVAI